MAGDGEGVGVGGDEGQAALEVGDGALPPRRRVLLRVALKKQRPSISMSSTLVQGDPSGWLQPPVDLGWGSYGSWWATIVATNCQARWLD